MRIFDRPKNKTKYINFLLLDGVNTLAVQPRDKCGAKAKYYDLCGLQDASYRRVCGSDNVTYSNVFDMACAATKYSVG
jgi:Kazal-type serine protease inhibitor domain